MSQMKKIMMILQLLLIACQAYAVDLYVIGSDVNGINWGLGEPSAKMTPVSPGVWEWTGETLSSGFKINDGTWSNPDYNIGSTGEPLTFGVPYHYYVSGNSGNIMFSSGGVLKNPHLVIDTNQGTILLEGISEVTEQTYYLVGTFNEWAIDTPEAKMEKAGSRYVKRELVIPEECDDIEGKRFKIASPAWADSWGWGYDSDKDCITPTSLRAILTRESRYGYGSVSDMPYAISGTYDVWWDPASSMVSFVKSGGNPDDPENPDDPFAVNYGDLYIIGDNVNGNHWLLADDSAKFAYMGNSQYEWSGSYLGNGFKINDGTWNNTVVEGIMLNFGSNGEGLKLDKPYYFQPGTSENIGFAEVTEVFNPLVTLDMAARTITVSADGHALTLTLPAEAVDGRYRNCVIELTDDATGIRQRCIVTDRLAYVFQGIGSKNTNTLRMFTSSGIEIALLEGIKMPKDDMEVAFSEIKSLYPVGVEVVASDGTAIADGLTIEWYAPDSEGQYSYMRQGREAGSWPAGTALLCKVALGEQLSALYANPSDTLLNVTDGNHLLRLPLTPLSRVRLTGKVTDDAGSPMDGVTVTLTQLLNSKYRYSASARTDRAGNWTLEAIEGSAPEIVFSAKDYVSQRTSLAAIGGDKEEIAVGTTVLPTITGAKISIAVSYRAAGSDDISSFFTDYQNLALEVFNLTQGRRHESISVQYPVLAVLDESINPGDELRLTLRSLTGIFSPVEKTVTLDADRKGAVEAVITGKGGIKAGFSMTDNPEVTASLYNAAGELVDKKTYSEASVSFTGLESGKYSLLSMGRSDMMDAPLRLSLLSELGLKEGKDYVLDAAEVVDGEMTLISNSEIPAFDESPYYYTTSNAGVSANKSSITTGNYLTLRADVDFRSAYASDIENVSLVFDFPEGSDFVNQSVIKGSALIPYTLEGNRLIIPLGDDWRKQVRFCVIPTVAGRFTATANIRFDYNGKEMMQPLGYASSTVKEMEITVPKVIQTPRFNVSGMTLADSQVSVYDDGVLLATGKSDANGAWKVECELPQAYNLSVHPIHAEVVTPSGNTLMSEKQNMTYDMNAIRVSKVTMYHWNPELNRTCVSEFDFLNPKTSGSQWDLYYPEKKFTYTIEFTENDPEKISNVILYVHTADGQFVPVAADYDENKGLWYAAIDMGSEANAYYPVNCSIDFDYITDRKIDVTATEEMENSLKDLSSDYSAAQKVIKEYFADRTEIDEDTLRNLLSSLGIENEITAVEENVLPENFDSWTEYEKEQYLDNEYLNLQQDNASLLSSLDYLNTAFVFSREMEYETDEFKFKITSCVGLNLSSLEEEGFLEMTSTNGGKVYTKFTEDKVTTIDLENDIYTEIAFKNGNPLYKVKKLVSFQDAADAYSKCMSIIGHVQTVINAKWTELTALAERPIEELDDAIRKITARKNQVTVYKNMSTKDNLKRLKWAEEEARLANALSSLKLAKKVSGPLIKKILKSLPIASYLAIVWDCYSNCDKVKSIFNSIPNPCPDDQTEADAARNSCIALWVAIGSKATADALGNFASDAAIVGGVLSSFVTAGTSLMATVMGAASKTLCAIGSFGIDLLIENTISRVGNRVAKLKCKEDRKCGEEGMPPCPPIPTPTPTPNGGNYPSGSSPDNPKQDPSGYVYEAVRDNRVEGVQASIYYKETKEDMYGEPYDEVTLWNAEEYAQRNPLFTDERGMYRWDVPQGLWQVKFEKDGYVTAYSEWLPVPPPQLDVNIAISQAKQPEVAEARAYEEGVEVRFDKFMRPLTLNTENIHVSVDGKTLPGRIELLDEGSSEEDADQGIRYASRVRFIPETPLGLTTGEIRLTVSPNVLSYCGVPMGEVFTQTLDVEKEVQAISAETTRVLYGEEKEITVFALPSEAAAGRRLDVASASDVILAVEGDEYRFDEEGKARIMVKGLLPGASRLYFSIPDVTVTGETDVDVVTEIIEAEAPKASRASGTEVYRGTKVELTTTSRDAVIYYTLDGSCPCDENGTRRKYTVPIVINGDTRILAMTMVGNNAEDVSDVAAFSYTLKRNAMDYTLAAGWNWLSHPFESPVAPESFAAPAVRRILGSAGEILPGTAEENMLHAHECYKVETIDAVTLPRMEDVAWNPSSAMQLKAGINWIGYPMDQTMSLDEAFSAMEPERSDVVIGQAGFAEFDGRKWVGTLETLEPGAGYLYKSLSGKKLLYNRSVVSKARARKARRAAAAGPEINIHKYPEVMPVVAVVTDKGETLDASRFEVTAYSGDECRGTGRFIEGRLMMSVYGLAEDEISFVLTDMSDFSQSELPAIPFEERVLGSLDAPYEFDLSSRTNGVAEAEAGSLSVEVNDHAIVIAGVDPSEIELVKVIDMEGKALLSVMRPESATIKLPALQEGIYVVVVDAAGRVTYRKVMLR